MTPVFLPFLFDNRAAWDRTVSDPRWQYDMPFYEFMNIYHEYRNGIVPDYKPQFTIPPAPRTVENILSQSEIDALLATITK
jgi:hypothetical protein